jgi:TadE-like protein
MLIRKRRPARRPGMLLTTEFLFVLPILLLIVLGLFEFVFLVTAETKLAAASREGARTAALGGSQGDVLGAVVRVLGPNAAVFVDTDALISYPLGTMNTGDPVQVTVAIPAKVLVPNLLFGIGFDVSKKTLSAHTTMVVE